MSPLHYAATRGQKEVVRVLLQRGAKVDALAHFKTDGPGERPRVTPLHLASIHGYRAVVKQLIAHGANVNWRARYNQTPLHRAALHRHKTVVLMLLRSGAHVDARANYVTDEPNTEPSVTALHIATAHGYGEIASVLLYAKADINSGDKNAWTPLHWATYHQFPELVAMLLRRGANVDAVARYAEDKSGKRAATTPLHLAAGLGSVDIIQELLAHNASVNAVDAYGETAVAKAARFGKTEALLLFLSRLDIRHTRHTRKTALHLAVDKGRVEVVKLLIKHGASAEERDSERNNALHLAVMCARLPIAKLLLQAQRSQQGKRRLLRAKNKEGVTPLGIAERGGRSREVVRLLRDADAVPMVLRFHSFQAN